MLDCVHQLLSDQWRHQSCSWEYNWTRQKHEQKDTEKLQDLLTSPSVDLIISSVDRSVVLLINVKDDLLFGDHEGDQQSLFVMSVSNMNDINVRLCFYIQV